MLEALSKPLRHRGNILRLTVVTISCYLVTDFILNPLSKQKKLIIIYRHMNVPGRYSSLDADIYQIKLVSLVSDKSTHFKEIKS